MPLFFCQLDIDNFGEVQDAIWDARSKWYNIGICLKLKVSDLDTIDAELGIDLEEKFRRMIKSWLRNSQFCTWRDLCEAMTHRTVAMTNVADEVKKTKLETLTGEFSVLLGLLA